MKDQDNKKERASCEYVIPAAVLDEMIQYIEYAQHIIDGEWGAGRDLKELISENQMPVIYEKLTALRNGI